MAKVVKTTKYNKSGKVTKQVTKNTASMTGRQRVSLNKYRAQQSAGKVGAVAREVGSTARSIAATLAATKGVDTLSANRSVKQYNDAALTDALNKYNSLINSEADQDGDKGNQSTSQVGGSGSSLGG